MNNTTTGPAQKEAQGKEPEIPAGDGAVRELEKEAVAAQRAPNLRPRDPAQEEPTVISLGKDPGGAPEDAVKEHNEQA